jgi:hypothetical protein
VVQARRELEGYRASLARLSKYRSLLTSSAASLCLEARSRPVDVRRTPTPPRSAIRAAMMMSGRQIADKLGMAIDSIEFVVDSGACRHNLSGPNRDAPALLGKLFRFRRCVKCGDEVGTEIGATTWKPVVILAKLKPV